MSTTKTFSLSDHFTAFISGKKKKKERANWWTECSEAAAVFPTEHWFFIMSGTDLAACVARGQDEC